VVLAAVNGEQQIGYQTGKYLNHQAVFAAGDEVIDPQVALPPGKKGLDVPAQFVNGGDFLSR